MNRRLPGSRRWSRLAIIVAARKRDGRHCRADSADSRAAVSRGRVPSSGAVREIMHTLPPTRRRPSGKASTPNRTHRSFPRVVRIFGRRHSSTEPISCQIPHHAWRGGPLVKLQLRSAEMSDLRRPGRRMELRSCPHRMSSQTKETENDIRNLPTGLHILSVYVAIGGGQDYVADREPDQHVDGVVDVGAVMVG